MIKMTINKCPYKINLICVLTDFMLSKNQKFSEKPEVFWCFQDVKKASSSVSWVKH